jgi:hypothetical protein
MAIGSVGVRFDVARASCGKRQPSPFTNHFWYLLLVLFSLFYPHMAVFLVDHTLSSSGGLSLPSDCGGWGAAADIFSAAVGNGVPVLVLLLVL